MEDKDHYKWILWVEKFNTVLGTIIRQNSGIWMTLQLEIDEHSWAVVQNIPPHPRYKLTVPEYFKGYSFKQIRMGAVKIIPTVDTKERIFQIDILQKGN